MKIGILNAFAVACIMIMIITQSTLALEPTPQYSYAVKFVCGESVESFQEGVVKGRHATAINIHNPSLKERIRFRKKVSRALPYQMAGPVTEFQSGIIGPNEAIEIECNEIRKLLPSPMTQEFRTGFVIIFAEREIDVVAVYTARPSGGEVSTIDVEVIEPRELSKKDLMLPDLTVRDIRMDTLQVRCPQGQGSCVTMVEVEIANVGEANVGAYNTKVTFDPDQLSIEKAIPGGLTPGTSMIFTVTTPPGKICYDPDCTICTTVDHKEEINESNESNNQLCKTREG